MQGTIRQRNDQSAWVVLHGLAVLSLLGLALLGQVPGEVAGWWGSSVACRGSVRVIGWSGRARVGGRIRSWGGGLASMAHYLLTSWPPVLMRSLLLWGLWEGSGRWGPGWLGLLPWVQWLWQGLAVGWPDWQRRAVWQGVQRGLWQGYRLLGFSYLAEAVRQVTWAAGGLAFSCVICAREEPWVQVARQADGSYQATLCGHFTLAVAADQPLRMRLLILVLSLLDTPGPQRGGRRTRDGRTPFVREMQLAQWFGVPQPDISRWLRWWLAGDWANLLSLHSAEVLTSELVARIVAVLATFPTWSISRVYHYLREQGLAVTEAQVAQAAVQSGWQQLWQTLNTRYDLSAQRLRLREDWLIEQLLAQSQALLARLESSGGLAPEVLVALADLRQLATEAGVAPAASVPAVPWLRRLEQVLLEPQSCEAVTDNTVRCPYCGSDRVGRKSVRPRFKQYYDAQGQLCQVAVYRYYCHNPQCRYHSFTHLPPGLLPYSRYRSELHLLAVQMYAWGYSTYRRTGTALGVASLTAWRWVSAWGYALLPVAALFGMVRSSGVVGVDEKYVLVPKNTKAEAEMRRWMYVYLAVDVWTYDLLHIAIYPYKDDASTEAFLLALHSKGYHPNVIVTDLRQDYGSVIARVFPQAIHHLCVFHALQDLQTHLKHVYGPDYATQHPEAERLKRLIYAIFDANTLALATQHYAAVLALRPEYVQALPAATQIFDFLERHWPKLANAIGSPIIPLTNNTVELVIRRFAQHYHSFCGFESLTDAQTYLAVFEKLYRFTPFSQDAQPRIRGKSPLQLAGYDVASLPMSTLCAGLSIIWPMHTAQPDHVP